MEDILVDDVVFTGKPAYIQPDPVYFGRQLTVQFRVQFVLRLEALLPAASCASVC